MSTYRKSSLLGSGMVHTTLAAFSIICILPIILIISISLSDEKSIAKFGYSLLPKVFSVEAYKYIFKAPQQIFHSYFISGSVTIIGSLLSLLVVSMLAYPLSRADFKHKNKISFYLFFTMLFNGGLVPWYILIQKYLGMKDTIWALIIPYLVNVWNVLLLRTYFQKMPLSIIESAKIDGAGEYRIFFTIILPLSKPSLATIGLFTVMGYWNDWWLSLLFINKQELIPLQYLLYRMMANIDFLVKNVSHVTIRQDVINFPNESARMAMCLVAAGPMLLVFPFFQKYFVKGLTLGAIKG